MFVTIQPCVPYAAWNQRGYHCCNELDSAMIQQSIVSFLLVAISHPRSDPQKTEVPFAMGLIGGTLA